MNWTSKNSFLQYKKVTYIYTLANCVNKTSKLMYLSFHELWLLIKTLRHYIYLHWTARRIRTAGMKQENAPLKKLKGSFTGSPYGHSFSTSLNSSFSLQWSGLNKPKQPQLPNFHLLIPFSGHCFKIIQASRVI